VRMKMKKVRDQEGRLVKTKRAAVRNRKITRSRYLC
jgi:hypothetical protein